MIRHAVRYESENIMSLFHFPYREERKALLFGLLVVGFWLLVFGFWFVGIIVR